MSGAYCSRFPECMKFSEKPMAPECSKSDCPGVQKWAKFFPVVAETDANAPGDTGLVSGATAEPNTRDSSESTTGGAAPDHTTMEARGR